MRDPTDEEMAMLRLPVMVGAALLALRHLDDGHEHDGLDREGHFVSYLLESAGGSATGVAGVDV